MVLLLALTAWADPVRCTATWSAPVVGCQVRGPVRVEATAAWERAARAQVVDQLGEVLTLHGVAARLKSTMLAEADFGACGTEAEAALLSCFPEPALTGTHLCFADFAARECWTGDVLNFEISGVRALDEGRERMCAAVDERIVALNYTDTAWRRASCAARCEAETRVRCPAD
jgi:hypothetical protein